MRPALLLSVAVAGLCLPASLLGQTAPARRAAAGPKAVATVMQVMEAMVIPASDAIFKVPVAPPKSDADWAVLRRQAVLLAESGNLLMVGPRLRDRAAWMKTSIDMREAGAAALKAVTAKNVSALEEAGNLVAESCEACHAVYLKR